MKTRPTNHDVIDAVLHEAALVDAELATTSRTETLITSTVHDLVRGRIAQLRRGLIPAADPPVRALPIRQSILALGRDGLIARLEELRRSFGGALTLAYRDLERLSDDDLRRMLELVDPSTPDE